MAWLSLIGDSALRNGASGTHDQRRLKCHGLACIVAAGFALRRNINTFQRGWLAWAFSTLFRWQSLRSYLLAFCF